jgi:Ca-activated chloride channel family protein
MARTASLADCSVLLFSLCSISLAFQSPSPDTTRSIPRLKSELAANSIVPQAHLRVDSSLVLIPVHVTTPDGFSVTNLTKENFALAEDNVEQTITTFSKDDAPLSVGLLFDSSGSMHNKMVKSSEAVATFFKTSNADDEFFLVEFNERPKLLVPFTPDSDEIYRRVARIRPFGRTSLLDAIHLAMVNMKKARNFRKAIVVLSDGGDNRSRFTSSEIKNALLETDVQLFAMGIFDEDARRQTVEEQNGPRLLDELAEQTGGRLYTVDNLDDLESISARISQELRNQYLLGYSPTNGSRDGKYRQVRLKLDAPAELPKLRTNYRHGYYAPED